MKKYFSKFATPYLLWLLVLGVFPAFVMLLMSFFDTEGFDVSNIHFTMTNFSQLTEKSTLIALGNSFFYSTITTLVCIVVGYIIAFILFRSKIKNKYMVLLILVLPMWSNLLLRAKAFKNFLDGSNVFFSFLEKTFNITINFQVDNLPIKIILGLVSIYLPLMIMSTYNSLEKVDYQLEEAALDLGLTPFTKFWKVIFPLSSKGIVTGSIMIFLPCFSSFAIPDILGDGNVLFMGNIIEQLFNNMNYNRGSLLAMMIFILIMSSIIIVSKVDKEGETLL